MIALAVGSRFEVQRFGRWELARVVGAYSHVDGAGSLFPGEPVQVFTCEAILSDGARGSSFTLRSDQTRMPVRLVEVGLFA